MAATAGAGGARDLASVAVGAGWLVVDKGETVRPALGCGSLSVVKALAKQRVGRPGQRAAEG